MFDLSGRVALVTGAGQGVGVGIATALAAQGARVIVNDVVAERATRVADAVGGRASVFDVTDPEAVDAAVGACGPIDILINNAGVPAGMRTEPFRTMARGEWDRYLRLNLYGALHCVGAVLDPMCERGWGRIIQISSTAGRTGTALGISLYGAAKSGAEGFIRHLSQEVAADGVTVNAIALGRMQSANVTERWAKSIPVGRLGTPADVGAAAVYVASDEAAWLTGQTLHLNGGQVTL